MINVERTEPHFPRKALRRWEALKMAHASATSSPRPLIYCSLSSYFAADVGFLRRVLKVFVKRSDWDLVLGLGGKLTAADLAPKPDNVLLLDWAPQLEILAHADSFITHGGTTSISESAWFGVPMVVYSTNHFDHDGNSMRVRYHGLGVVADKDTDHAKQIERNIEKTMSDPDIRRNVAAMRDLFREYDRSNRAVELVESYISWGLLTRKR
jgi:MGT family glycosyltransferase